MLKGQNNSVALIPFNATGLYKLKINAIIRLSFEEQGVHLNGKD